MNKKDLAEQVLWEANHIFRTKDTCRDAARVFGRSPSTIRRDMVVVLPKIDPVLAARVRRVLDFNKEAAPSRGGYAKQSKRLYGV